MADLKGGSNACCTGARRGAVGAVITVVALAFILWPASGHTGEEPTIEGMLESMERHNVPAATAALPRTTTSPVNLEVQWRLWNRAITNGEPGLTELTTLSHDATSLGIPSLPNQQLAILHHAQRADEYGLSDPDIRQLKDKAYSLAPHLPYAQFEIARWELETSLSTGYRAIPPYTRGVETAYEWLDTRIGWGLKWALILLLTATICLVIFVLTQLLRYFGIAAYDGTRALPRGFSSTQTVILLVAIVLIPGLLLQSPLLSMLLLLALVLPFQQINERIVSCAFFALLAALPWADDRLGEFLTYPQSDAQRLLHAHYHGCDEDCRSWLANLVEANDDEVARYVERVAIFRNADQNEMATLHQWFEENEPQADSPLSAHWLTLRGAVAVAVGESEEAVEWLEQASAEAPLAAAPWFNQTRAFQILDDTDRGQQALEAAFSRDIDGIYRKLEFTRRDPHSFLMIHPLSGDFIWRYHLEEIEEPPSLLMPYWTVAAGEDFQLRHASWLGLGGILLVLLTLPLYLSRRLSTPCPKCGLARDPEEADQTGEHHYCLPCYQTFASGASMDYHARIQSEATLGRRVRLQQFLRRLFSLLAPGSGHILAGHTLRGVLALGAVVTGVLLLLYPLGPFGAWRGPFDLFYEHWGGQSLAAWILISIGGSVGLTGLVRGVESTRIRSRRQADEGGAP